MHFAYYQLREFVSISVTVTSLNLVICNWFLVTRMFDFLLLWRQEVTGWLPLWFSHCYFRCFNNYYRYIAVTCTCAFTKCCYFVHWKTTQTFHEMFGKIKIFQCLPVRKERQKWLFWTWYSYSKLYITYDNPKVFFFKYLTLLNRHIFPISLSCLLMWDISPLLASYTFLDMLLKADNIL